MPGIVSWVPGTGPGTGPIIPNALHSTGADQYEYVNRYVAEQHKALASGAAITSLRDYGSRGQTLNINNPALIAVTKGKDTIDYARVVAAPNQSGVALITDASNYDDKVTIVAVMRRVQTATRLFGAGGATYQIQGNQVPQLSRGGAATFGNTTLPAAWAFTAITLDGLDYKLQTNAATASGTLATGSTNPSPVSFGGNSGWPEEKESHLAELIVWNRALTTAELAAVRTAMKARYSVLP